MAASLWNTQNTKCHPKITRQSFQITERRHHVGSPRHRTGSWSLQRLRFLD